MKLWKKNKINQEWEIDNNELAKKFLESDFYKNRYEKYGSTRIALIYFISDKEGLNSLWDWNKKKGSINGSKDMLRILSIIAKYT